MENIRVKMGEIGEEQKYKRVKEPISAPFIIPIPTEVPVEVPAPQREKVPIER